MSFIYPHHVNIHCCNCNKDYYANIEIHYDNHPIWFQYTNVKAISKCEYCKNENIKKYETYYDFCIDNKS